MNDENLRHSEAKAEAKCRLQAAIDLIEANSPIRAHEYWKEADKFMKQVKTQGALEREGE